MVIIIIAALFMCGCATTQPSALPDVLPQLVYQSPLPAWPAAVPFGEVALDLKLRISTDGSVLDASFIPPTGNKEWDASAISEIRKWRFSPALADGRPVTLWIRQKLHVRFENPSIMSLAELVCSEQHLADSLYALLSSHASFDQLARTFSISGSREQGGVIGDTDLRTLPYRIRLEVADLHENEFTKPLVMGRNYVIYKRLARSL